MRSAVARPRGGEGEVVYYPEEVAILLEIKEKLPEDIAKDRIQRIHQVKKHFGGLVIEVNWNRQKEEAFL